MEGASLVPSPLLPQISLHRRGSNGSRRRFHRLCLPAGEDLARVGLVVWQAGFVLGDLLLRRPPYGSWHGATVLDLGCGTGGWVGG